MKISNKHSCFKTSGYFDALATYGPIIAPDTAPATVTTPINNAFFHPYKFNAAAIIYPNKVPITPPTIPPIIFAAALPSESI